MRHNVYGKHLGRDKNQRTALFRGLIRSLVLEGSIVTTEAKVKAIKGLADKLFVKAKKGDQASLNVLTRAIPQEDVAKKIIELAKGFKKRNSGFTETVRLGMRAGDGAMMMRMSIISSVIASEAKQSAVKEIAASPSTNAQDPRNDNDKKPEKKEKTIEKEEVKTEIKKSKVKKEVKK